MWVQLAIAVVSYAISYFLAPTPKAPKPAAFEDVDFPLAEEGTEQYVIFGDCWTQDWVVLAVGNYRTSAIRKKGGKK